MLSLFTRQLEKHLCLTKVYQELSHRNQTYCGLIYLNMDIFFSFCFEGREQWNFGGGGLGSRNQENAGRGLENNEIVIKGGRVGREGEIVHEQRDRSLGRFRDIERGKMR